MKTIKRLITLLFMCKMLVKYITIKITFKD